MHLYRITKGDFANIDWQAVRQHVHSKIGVLQDELLFLRDVPGFRALINPDNVIRKNDNVILCQFWIDPDDYKKKHFRRGGRYCNYKCPCNRKIVNNPRRFNYLTKWERNVLFEFFRSLGSPWINLRGVWIEQERGLVTVHFKVNNYGPFWKEKQNPLQR